MQKQLFLNAALVSHDHAIVDDIYEVTHVFFLLVLMGVDERPENHLVSMFCPQRITLLGSLPILCASLHALSKNGSSL